MNKYWSETIKGIAPYVPGEQPRVGRLVKLNTNENPYPPSPEVLNAMRAAVTDELRLYPDPNCSLLRETASRYYGIPAEQIFAGNGSDEILAFCFKAFFDSGDTILFPDITYNFYEVYARLFGVSYRTVPLTESFDVPVEGFYTCNDGVILANPNAPTGKVISLKNLEALVKHNRQAVVIIDEAYIDFGGESAIGLIPKYDNLLVIRTFSKSRSLAGLRIGLALGHRGLIEALIRVRDCINCFTVDWIAQAGAIASLEDTETFTRNIQKVIATRDRITALLRQAGFRVVDSSTNFLLISHLKVKADALNEALRRQNIFVRLFPKPRIDNYLRVTIGTDEEMDILYQALLELVRETRETQVTLSNIEPSAKPKDGSRDM
ncbi:histidinol-phosphate aminotransferase [Paenibacillus forsythiae]|uniref:Histidinol-phosphate aminotransferase n=1 Tax=Paenibacillus forsythiae TaxID=365616 RepID=A0ABU3H7T9_9BACL|nr:histidinol-phosphate transaminase [Paenibacillus forsythiae]MDT3426893.1 histidinol-phosphate aminotransferase [Paenibacillus forsythiae]